MIRSMGLLLAILMPATGLADFPVLPVTVEDFKPVFATVESTDVVAARARIGGTLAGLAVDEGDSVVAGTVLAVVGDDKIALQLAAVDARIRALSAQRDQAVTEVARARELRASGTIAQARLDDAETTLDVVENGLAAARADRSVLAEQLAEGQVLAPTDGRVLTVPVTDGVVVMPGEAIARIAAERFVLRLSLPERHARFLQPGATVRVGARGRSDDAATARDGSVLLIYPQLEAGRVIADVEAAGLEDHLVGERVRVWVPIGRRTVLAVPEAMIDTRFGVDFVTLKTPDGAREIVVQRGEPVLPVEGGGPLVQLLGGVRGGDILVRPRP